LDEYTRARVPLQWATTQNNLGNALRVLGERESGTARLDEAVAAFRDALQERTRARVPLDWASTQMNLALVYRVLFDKDHQPRHLDDALEAVDPLIVKRPLRDGEAESAYRRLPIIALAAIAMKDDHEKCLEEARRTIWPSRSRTASILAADVAAPPN
jgi:tetratricopeptide (TPR) repeat protein